MPPSNTMWLYVVLILLLLLVCIGWTNWMDGSGCMVTLDSCSLFSLLLFAIIHLGKQTESNPFCTACDMNSCFPFFFFLSSSTSSLPHPRFHSCSSCSSFLFFLFLLSFASVSLLLHSLLASEGSLALIFPLILSSLSILGWPCPPFPFGQHRSHCLLHCILLRAWASLSLERFFHYPSRIHPNLFFLSFLLPLSLPFSFLFYSLASTIFFTSFAIFLLSLFFLFIYYFVLLSTVRSLGASCLF